jgi:hypothetical protein
MVAPSKSFQEINETRPLARKMFGAFKILEQYGLMPKASSIPLAMSMPLMAHAFKLQQAVHIRHCAPAGHIEVAQQAPGGAPVVRGALGAPLVYAVMLISYISSSYIPISST